MTYLRSLGVEPITGKPGKPTTQGKNERFHQTLTRYLNKQPVADTFAQLQAQIDTFDHAYNTEREHQALPPGMTPQAMWDATPKAPSPTPPDIPTADGHGIRRVQRTVARLGTITLHRGRIYLGTVHAAKTVHAVYDAATVDIYDEQDTLIGTALRPEPGKFINANPPAPGPTQPPPNAHDPQDTEPSTTS